MIVYKSMKKIVANTTSYNINWNDVELYTNYKSNGVKYVHERHIANSNTWLNDVFSFFFFIDPYVKIYLVNNGQRVAKKKTHVKKRTLNPVFNESFVFDLPVNAPNLENISLEFLVLDWDRVTKNEVNIALICYYSVLIFGIKCKCHDSILFFNFKFSKTETEWTCCIPEITCVINSQLINTWKTSYITSSLKMELN